MSTQKKTAILQQLEQAIKRKVNEKSKMKDQTTKNFHASIEKKRANSKVLQAKEHNKTGQNRVISSFKTKQNLLQTGALEKSKQNFANVSIASNNLSNLKNNTCSYSSSIGSTFQVIKSANKKHGSRKWEKFLSMINYLISSSEKAVNFIGSNNFQADFAVKLFKSDRENLISQIKNFDLTAVISEIKANEKIPASSIDGEVNYQYMLEQNLKLKKQIVLLEKQAERFHTYQTNLNSTEQNIAQNDFSLLGRLLIQITNPIGVQKLSSIMQKDAKFKNMVKKAKNNKQKVSQIEQILEGFSKQAIQVFIQNLNSTVLDQIHSLSKTSKSQTQRSQRIRQFHFEKEQLLKQINALREQIQPLKELDNVKSENTKLKHQINNIDSEIRHLISNFTEHHQQIKETNQKNIVKTLQTFIQFQNKIHKNNISKLQSQINKIQNQRAQKAQTLQYQNRRISQLEQEIYNHQKSQTKQQNLKQYSESQQKLTKIQGELSIALNHLQKKQNQILILQDRIQQLLNKQEQLKSYQQNQKSYISGLQAQRDEHESNTHQLSQKLTQLQNKLTELNLSLQQKQAQVQNMIETNKINSSEYRIEIARKNDQIQKLITQQSDQQLRHSEQKDKLACQLTSKLNDIVSLEVKVTSLNGQKDQNQNLIEQLSNQLKRVKQQNQKLIKQNQNHQNQLLSSLQNNKIRESQKQQQQQQIQKQMQQLMKQSENLSNKLQRQKQSNLHQINQIKQLNQIQQIKINQELDLTKTTLISTQKELDSVKKLNQLQKSAQVSELQSKIIELEQAIASLNQDLQSESNENMQFSKEIQQLKQSTQQLILQIENKKKSLEQQCSILKQQLQEKDKLIAENRLSQQKLTKQYQRKLQMQRVKGENYQRLRREKQQEIQNYRLQNQQKLKMAQMNFNTLNEENQLKIKQKQLQIEEIEQEHQKETLSLKEQIQKLQNHQKQKQNLNQQLKKQLQQYQIIIKQKQSTFTSTVNNNSQNQLQSEIYTQKINDLELKLKQANDKLCDLTQDFQSLKLENRDYIKENTSLKDKFEELQLSYTNKIQELQQLNASFSSLKNLLKQSSKRQEQYDLQNTQNQKRITELLDTNRQLQLDIQSQTVRSSQLQCKVQQQQKTIKTLMQENSHEIEIHNLKLKQYVFFIRKILQSTNIQFQDLREETNLDVLLSVGSQRIVQMKRRIRDQQSNRKKSHLMLVQQQHQPNQQEQENHSGNNNNQIVQFPSAQNIQENNSEVLPSKLFNSEPQQGSGQKCQNIFQKVSVISSINKREDEAFQDGEASKQNSPSCEENDIDEFNEIESQELEKSFASQIDGSIQQQQNENENLHMPAQQKEQQQQIIQKSRDNSIDNNDQADLQNFADYKETSLSKSQLMSEKGLNDGSIDKSQGLGDDIENFADYQESNSVNNSMISQDLQTENKVDSVGKSNQELSNSKNEENSDNMLEGLDDFQDAKNQSMSSSMISKNSQKSISDKNKNKHKNDNENENGINPSELEEFPDYQSQMDSSMISQQQQQEPNQRNIQEAFSQINKQQNSKQKKQQKNENKTTQENDFQAFNDLNQSGSESLNSSMVSMEDKQQQ